MPPKRGIVKSGNAGNSNKVSKQPSTAGSANPAGAVPGQEKPQPLFPVGSKTPLSLLYERCQKNGWEKPDVEPRSNREGGFTCSIVLKRISKKTSSIESVRMDPHPALRMDTKEKAKHWAATYVLYRVANNIQLHLVLPTEPRKYWFDLAEEHKKAPDHLAWQYSPDPFAARRSVEERQAKRAINQAIAKESGEDTLPSGFSARDIRDASGEYEGAPEIRMSSALRTLVENAIKQTTPLFPGMNKDFREVAAPTRADSDITDLEDQLQHLGFSPHLAAKAAGIFTPLTPTSPYLESLFSLPTLLDSAISHLLLTTDEAELPKQFMAGDTPAASSEGFITSGYSGQTLEHLVTRWIKDRAMKDVGWPESSVSDCLAMEGVGDDWALLMEQLGRRLVGATPLTSGGVSQINLVDEQRDNRDSRRESEIEAFLSVYPGATFSQDTGELSFPLTNGPIVVHFIYAPNHPYPLAQPSSAEDGIYQPIFRAPPVYLTSPSAAPYIRLFLLSRLLASLLGETSMGSARDPALQPLLEAGDDVLFSTIELLEAVWNEVETEGPPDVGDVMRFLLPPPLTHVLSPTSTIDDQVQSKTVRSHLPRSDPRPNSVVLEEFVAMTRREGYETILQDRQKLPAWNSRDDIVRLVNGHRVVVIVGETGCGKTTQLPQFILDSQILSHNGQAASIMITQPRRVSALGVASRVSSERLNDGSVGYAIRGESNWNSQTKLLFVTTGVALRRLALDRERMLTGISHIIVDEVHERSVDGDFLLLELLELLQRNKTIKVILMSATINQQTFVDYFGGAPVLEIPGFTHNIKDMYLEDFIPLIEYRPTPVRPNKRLTEEERLTFRTVYQQKGLSSDSIHAIETSMYSDKTDYQLIAAVVTHILSHSTKPSAAILIFMSGLQEIRQTVEILKASPEIRRQVEILPLHANLSNEEQKKVFLPTSRRKVVVATNVAETSITIPDVVYVVDVGKVKETSYDVDSGLSRLTENWVTKAAARQRRGRAGRTQPGECYKLFTRYQEDKMRDYPIPEILRVPLEALSLQVKFTREDEDVKLFLSKAIDPPQIAAMEKAWESLDELGAIDEDGKLTAMGKHLSLLPIDLRLGKMLLLGAIFRCLDPLLTTAALLSSKSLFLSPTEQREEASRARQQFSTGNSDILTDVTAYNRCISLRKEGSSAVRRFCEDNFISASTLRDVASLRREFLAALASVGFVPLNAEPDMPELNANSGNQNLVKALILGGLWPRVARVKIPKAVFDKVQAGTIQRDHEAKEYKVFDSGGRVFIHPQSLMFHSLGTQKSPFLAYFAKSLTSKVFLRDVTEVPLYAILLFGGAVSVNHVGGGLTIGGPKSWVKMKAWPRIGVLVNQLRRLLDSQLAESFDDATMVNIGKGNLVTEAMLALLENDGLSH